MRVKASLRAFSGRFGRESSRLPGAQSRGMWCPGSCWVSARSLSDDLLASGDRSIAGRSFGLRGVISRLLGAHWFTSGNQSLAYLPFTRSCLVINLSSRSLGRLPADHAPAGVTSVAGRPRRSRGEEWAGSYFARGVAKNVRFVLAGAQALARSTYKTVGQAF